jgi:hypothetical protein
MRLHVPNSDGAVREEDEEEEDEDEEEAKETPPASQIEPASIRGLLFTALVFVALEINCSYTSSMSSAVCTCPCVCMYDT